MATEENKAIARRVLEELFNQGNLELVDEILGKLAREGANRGAQELEEKGVYLLRPVLRNPMARVREALEAQEVWNPEGGRLGEPPAQESVPFTPDHEHRCLYPFQ